MTGPQEDDFLYLTHIGECLTRIFEYTRGGHDEFLADSKTQDAVLRNLQIMAESTQRLSGALKATRPEVDCRGISAFRNVLTYAYLSINMERVWATVINDLHPFAQQISIMRPSDPQSGG